ncbi:MAG TPA: NAD(P)-dependent oxidoreductase [Erysipelotrichaceae bacterium]|nr:NAD(P)-dependent oxidoreductase [Erysipelotrichaceae bacterium]
MKILVTGAAGMIGSHLVKSLKKRGYKVIGLDIREAEEVFVCDLGKKEKLEKIVKNKKMDRIIHLAALAHAVSGKKYTRKMYEYSNIECAKNVFNVARDNKIPVLFISTVDVFGFQKGIVDTQTECRPITIYGKTKYEAEQLLRNSGANYTIFRLSPVYSEDEKRDIQKRIYLRYPNWAYQIGKNTQYEVLHLDKAIEEMIKWCGSKPKNEIRIIKDEQPMNSVDYIEKEKTLGKAKHVVKIPRWLATLGYVVLRITGKNKYTFLLNKAINPLRSE